MGFVTRSVATRANGTTVAAKVSNVFLKSHPCVHFLIWGLVAAPMECRMTREPTIVPDGSDPSTDAAAQERAKGKLFLRLFVRNERRVYAYILTLLLNRTDTDDVFQEVSL